jgi:hypothetical protein
MQNQNTKIKSYNICDVLPPAIVVKIQTPKPVSATTHGFVCSDHERINNPNNSGPEFDSENLVLHERNYMHDGELPINDAFIGAFLLAYNSHGDIRLDPTDIWVVILSYLSEYLTKYASDALQTPPTSIYNNHNTDSDLDSVNSDNSDNSEDSGNSEDSDPNTITLYEPEFGESLLSDATRPTLLKTITNTLRDTVTSQVADTLFAEFSTEKYHTCSYFHACAATTSSVGSITNHFSPKQLESCGQAAKVPQLHGGIANAIFNGQIGDWIHLLNKLDELKICDTGNGVLLEYIAKVGLILNQFIISMHGAVSTSFWNTIFQTKFSTRLRSQLLFGTSTQISGWILHFYGIYEPRMFVNLPTRQTHIPIHVLSSAANTMKQLSLTTGFSGVCKLQNNAFAPQLYTKLVLNETIQLSKISRFTQTCKFGEDDILCPIEIKDAITNCNTSIPNQIEPLVTTIRADASTTASWLSGAFTFWLEAKTE